MAATSEALAPAASASRPEALYRKLSPGPGMPAPAVAFHQRARIHGAMVELIGDWGWQAVTVRELSNLAGVSTRTFYEHFAGGKEECLLSTHELIVQRATARVAASQNGERDWQERLRLAFEAFSGEIASKSGAARLALVETFALGSTALERMQCSEGTFESMLRESFARAPDGVEMPPLLVKGIVAGVAHVVRVRLLAGREEEVPNLAGGLLEWALSLRCPEATEMERLSRRSGSTDLQSESIADGGAGAADKVCEDERALILTAVAKLAAAEGYRQLTASRIRLAAGVRRSSFDAHFKGVDDCFLAAIELRALDALEHAAAQAAGGDSWSGGVYRGIEALCVSIARDPVLTKLAFVEAYAPGMAGMRCRESLIDAIAARFRDSAPKAQQPSMLSAEASAGAAWGVLHHCIASRQARQLPQLAATLSFLALAPVIGASAATEAIKQEQQRATKKQRSKKLD